MLRAFLQLIRLPNFLTVPGDILVGGLVATGGAFSFSLFWAGILASLCFYGFGIVLNDAMDAAVDRRERPDRPIPSGAISRIAAFGIASLFCVAGFAVLFFASNTAALFIGGVLCILIAAYNFGLKRIPLIGVLTMAACRGCNVILGMVAIAPSAENPVFYQVFLNGFQIAAYVFAFSVLALRETDSDSRPGYGRFLPAILFAFFVYTQLNAITVPVTLMGGAVIAFLFAVCWRAGRGVPLPRAIGQLLQGLVLIQAWFCATQAGVLAIPVFALLLSAVAFGFLTRYFYAS